MTSKLVRLFFLSAPQSHFAEKWLTFAGATTMKVTLVLAAGFTLGYCLRRPSAAVRHLVWVSTLCATLALPGLTLILPVWQIRASSAKVAPTIIKVSGPVAATSGASAPQPSLPLAVAVEGNTASALPPWFRVVMWTWALGFVLVLGRTGIGIARVALLARQAEPMDGPDWTELLRNLSGQLGLKRAPAMVRCKEPAMPMAWGIARGMILLPCNANGWSSERKRVVLCHELAHVRRLDNLTQLLGRMACAVYWFHPLVWLAARKLRQESEKACDDRVLSLGTKGCDYAEHLLDLARSLVVPRTSWAPVVSMAQPSQLEGRMVALLDRKRDRRPATRKNVLFMTAALAALVLPVAALRGTPAAENGKITGRIYDPSGAVIPQAVITLTNLDSKTRQAMTTNDEGEYDFPAIPAGNYQAEVSKPGFGYFQRRQLEVKAGGDVRLDVILNPGMVTESIDVVAKGHPKTGTEHPPKVRQLRIGGDMQAAKLIHRVEPVYPADAMEKGVVGTVLLSAVISIDGRVLSLKVINDPDPQLAAAAVDAVNQWHYRPTLLNGEPIEVVTTITVRFSLKE